MSNCYTSLIGSKSKLNNNDDIVATHPVVNSESQLTVDSVCVSLNYDMNPSEKNLN